MRLRGDGGGVHALLPAVFDEFHFCAVDASVHASLLDARFRVLFVA